MWDWARGRPRAGTGCRRWEIGKYEARRTNALCCQGFRFYDEAGAGDWFSRDLVQKRPVDFTSNLNSVPMMGKREPEAVQQSDNNPQFVVEEAL